MKFFVKGLLLSLAASSSAVHAGKVVSVSDARLPMSISTVVSELEAGGMKEGLTTACLITSRGVTRSEKGAFLVEALELEGASITSKVVGVEGGVVVTQPKTLEETIIAAGACDGTILYYPSSSDLERGEGLFDTLAPTIERIVVAMDEEAISTKPACLMVVSNDLEAAGAKTKFEEAANKMLQNLAVSSKKLSQLSDAFSQVVYVTPSQVSGKLSIPREAAEIKATVSSSSSVSLSLASPSSKMAPRDLAAARLLGAKTRTILEDSLQVVKSAVEAAQDDTTETLVTNLGPLIDSTIARAKEDLKTAASSEGGIVSSSVFQQLSQNLEQELQSELLDIYQKQLSILQLTAYEGFKKRLSQLRITPGLSYEMDQVVQKSVEEFSTLAKKLQSKSMTDSGSNIVSAKAAFGRKCKEYTSDRLIAAEASGQFKPIPRKGFSVGFHWLLPKPFGNDYRQEPWMVHATDNMVYIPKGKVTEVGPSEVATGDWRDKIVPSPAGNDMIFMQ